MKKIIKIEMDIRKDIKPHEELNTKYEILNGELKILSSSRFAQSDIKKLGQEKILSWIKQDNEMYQKYKDGMMVDYIISAKALIKTSKDGKKWIINEILSNGISGIPCNAGSEYTLSIFSKQKKELREVLIELGFNKTEIDLHNEV